MTDRYRVETSKAGCYWPYVVVVGTGVNTRILFSGFLQACKQVAGELTTAFEEGEQSAKRGGI